MTDQPLLSVQRSSSRRSHSSKDTFAHLPLMRFTSVATILVALDALVSIALWLAGGDSLYLEDGVKDFSIYTSTFDLACLAAARGVLIVCCLYYLEQYSLLSVSSEVLHRQVLSRRIALLCHASIIILALSSLIYSLVKGVLVLLRLDADGVEIHVTYKILCCFSVAATGVELLIGLSSFWFMRRLTHVHKIRLVVNETEDGVAGGDGKKKSADLKRLAKMAVPEYPVLFLGIAMLIVSSGSQAVAPYLFGTTIDLAIRNDTLCQAVEDGKINATGPVPHCSLWLMSREVLFFFGLMMIASVAAMGRNWAFTLAGEKFVARLRKKLFAAIVKQEMGFFDTNRTGELTNRLASDTSVIQSAVTENISILFRYMLQMILSLCIMFYISAKLTAVLVSVVPIIIVGAVQYGRFLKGLRKKFQDKLAEANSVAEETISNMRTVRSFSNEGKRTALYDKDIDVTYGIGKRLALLGGLFTGFVFPLVYGAAALVLWYGSYLVFHGHLTAGTLTSLMLYTLNLAVCFAFISNVYGEFMQAVGASVRIFVLLDREPEVKDGITMLPTFKGEIEFRNVSFTYPSRPEDQVLKNVAFHVKPGQVVALVGPSGGGKSTIVSLIEHFYEIDSGRVLVGGMDVSGLDPAWFRKYIGIVNQEPVLFATSIADNIRFGKEDATHEEIVEAACQANAHNFVMTFENQYETLVGERGVRLSGGQKQRIAIARALLLQPDILLLDEATSALDAESEHLVQEAIDRAMRGRTVLVIAHRLSTVRNAHQVMVIDRGCIVEQGTHEQLIAMDSVYKKLVLRQMIIEADGN